MPIRPDRFNEVLHRVFLTDYKNLFFQYSYTLPPLEEQIYLYMKRFRQQYSEIMSMPIKLRNKLFLRELAIVKKEAEKIEAAKNKK